MSTVGSTDQFSAHAFHTSLHKGRSSGILTVSASGFMFMIDGQKKVNFPLAGALISLGGASDRLVFLHHPNVPDWSFYTSDRSIFNHQELNNHPELAQQIKPLRHKRLVNWSVLAAVCLLVMLIPTLLVFNMSSVSAMVVKQIPLEWEATLGESAYAQYQLQHDELNQEKTTALLTKITRTLTQSLENNQYTFTFHIVNDPELNAFALPGGTIVIHSGLIIRADNASELLGVLAHEIAHVTQQHGLRNIITSAGAILTVQALLGDASGLMATIAAAAPFLLNLQYSRRFETQADEHGLELLKKANINPSGLLQFFEKLMIEQEKIRKKITNEGNEKLIDNLTGFLSTHPATQERFDHIASLMDANADNYRNIDPLFHALKTQVEAFVTSNKQEQSNENSN